MNEGRKEGEQAAVRVYDVTGIRRYWGEKWISGKFRPPIPSQREGGVERTGKGEVRETNRIEHSDKGRKRSEMTSSHEE